MEGLSYRRPRAPEGHDTPTGEFIRRFLIHVLPHGFHRIRHYGLLASGTPADNIARVRRCSTYRRHSPRPGIQLRRGQRAQAARAPVPVLPRPYGHHRDVRARLNAPRLTTSLVAPEERTGRRPGAYCSVGDSDCAGKRSRSRRLPVGCRRPSRCRPP